MPKKKKSDKKEKKNKQGKKKERSKKNLSPKELKKRLKKKYREFGGLKGKEIQERLQTLEGLGLVTGNGSQKKHAPLPAEVDVSEAKKGEKRPFHVIAHRGWSGSYPENTLIGMREAIKLGCPMIEFDVTLTKDRRIIIIHDETLSRTTNAAGEVAEWNYKDLRNLDAGAWFHPKYKGAKLPSLDEVLLISRGSGIYVNIEIKKEAWDEEDNPDNIERQVIAKIVKYGVEDRVLISSFRWGFIERIHKLAPNLRTALLHYKDVGQLDPKHLKEKYGIYAFNPHCIDMTQKFVDACHEAGLKVYPFTINAYQDMQKYFDMGVDGMFTNHPNRLFKFIKDQNLQIHNFRKMEYIEDASDKEMALAKLEREQVDKAMRRARWSAKRQLLTAQKNTELS